jgi:hypothetical protein
MAAAPVAAATLAAGALIAMVLGTTLPASPARAQPPQPADPVLDDATLRREYDDYRASVRGMRLYHVRYIRVATEPEARDLIAWIRSGDRFEERAGKHSIHPESAAKGGDLGTHASCRWGKTTLEMLDLLKPRQTWPQPVKGTHGWGVYRLESVADLQARSYSRYRSELLSGKFEPECPWVPPVTIAPASPAGVGRPLAPPSAAPVDILRK